MASRINYLLLATALLGTFFSGTATRIVAISMPTVAQSLGTDLLGMSWALLSYQLSNIGLSVVFGRISDLWGREKMFALGFLVFAVSSLLCGFSQSVMQLILSRFVQGVGGAMLQSSSRALASESVTEDLAGRAQGYMTTAHHVGFILGPSIGGIMIDYFSWRWSFFLLAPVGFGGAVLALANMKRHQTTAPNSVGSIDYLGAALLFAITSTLVFIFDRRTHEIVGGSIKLLLVAVFLGSLIGFLVHESRARYPFVNLALFKIRRFSFSVISLLIIAMGYSLTGFLMPFYLQGVLHLSPTKIGILFMAPSILTVALAPLSGYMSDRFGPRIPATLGVALMIGSLAVGGFLSVDSHWLMPALADCCRGCDQRHFQSGQFHCDDRYDGQGAPWVCLGDQSRHVWIRQCLRRGARRFVHVAGLRTLYRSQGRQPDHGPSRRIRGGIEHYFWCGDSIDNGRAVHFGAARRR